MHRARRVVLAYLLLALPLLPSIASATDLSADVGVAAAVPTGAGPSFLGSAATFGIAWPVAPAHALGLTVRSAVVTPVAWPDDDDGVPVTRSGAHPSAMLLGTYRLLSGARASWGTQLTVGLGFGLWPTCIRGDLCGGGGPATSVQGAVRRRLGPRTALLIGAELATQFGMGNLVDVMVMPRAFVGISG